MRAFRVFSVSFSLLLVLFWIINTYIKIKAEPVIFFHASEVPLVEVILVPGASVFRSGDLSPILKKRVETAIEYSHLHDSLPLLFSGHSVPGGYNEPLAMKLFSLAQGIPEAKIILDEKGTSTFSTINNLKKQGLYKNILIVSQNFHLPRALMISRSLNLNCYGLVAPGNQIEGKTGIHIREISSRIKDFFLLKFFKLFTRKKTDS